MFIIIALLFTAFVVGGVLLGLAALAGLVLSLLNKESS